MTFGFQVACIRKCMRVSVALANHNEKYYRFAEVKYTFSYS